MTRTSEPDRTGASSATSSPWVLTVLAVLAGVGAALSGAEPTGGPVIDALWCAGLGAGITLVAARARPWTWAVLAAVATVAATGSTVALACGLVGLALAVGAATVPRCPAIVGPISVAIATQALFRLPDVGFFGLPTVVGVVAVVPLVASAWAASSRRTRRRAVAVSGSLVGLGVVVLVGFGVAGAAARPSVQEGIDASRSGLAALRSGDEAATVVDFDDATRSFDDAHAALTAPWALPVRLVPGAAQQARALSEASAVGADLSSTAATLATEADYRGLRSAQGTIDLATLVSMQEPVARSADALAAAESQLDSLSSGWLLPPIASPLESLGGEVRDQRADADLADQALSVAPDLLGASGPRRYVVLFTNPAESRFQGGFVGAFAELTVEDGKVTLGDTVNERVFADTVAAGERTLTVSPDILARYRRYDPSRFLQNLTVSPDTPTDAALVRELYPQLTGRTVDGVIIADPFALAAFLELTGPVSVEGLDTPLTSANAVDHLLKGQYTTDEANSERKERLGDAARATFDALTSRDLPGPGTLADVLGPAVREGHLQFVPFADAENAFLDRLGAIRRFDPRPGADYVSLRTANANPNKLDPYLQRRLDYDVRYEPTTGVVTSTATVTLTNTAPLTGLVPYVAGNERSQPDASNTMYLSFYSPLSLQAATLDRAPLAIEPQREFGGQVYSALVTVPAGQTTTLRFELEGLVTTGADYRLDVLSQPMINPDGVRIAVGTDDPDARIGSADGLVVVGDGASIDATLTENRRFGVDFVAR